MPGPGSIIARWFRDKPANNGPNRSICVKIFNSTNYTMRVGANSGIDSGQWNTERYPDKIASGETAHFHIATWETERVKGRVQYHFEGKDGDCRFEFENPVIGSNEYQEHFSQWFMVWRSGKEKGDHPEIEWKVFEQNVPLKAKL